MSRILTIGDLNGADNALGEILELARMVDGKGRWCGGNARVIQVGDIFNRGPGARRAFARLRRLDRAARRQGGSVTILLGNHEVMTALGNEAYCTIEEYLDFAPPKARRRWRMRAHRHMMRLFRDHPRGGPILPIQPRLDAWAVTHVPGRRELRRALGPRGALRRALIELPIAVRVGKTVFIHSLPGLAWARRGVDGMNQAAREAWREAPRFWRDLPQRHLFRAVDGPLWNRELVLSEGREARREVERVLTALDADHAVIGHTQTMYFPSGEPGRIALAHGGRVVGVDVALASQAGAPRAALLIRGSQAWEISPNGRRRLW